METEHTMAKFCANGHQIEDTWEVCPYCQRPGFDSGVPAMAGKARSQFEPGQEPAKPSGRKGVLVAEQPKPPVVGWFVVLTGPQKGEDFRVREGPNIIGSAADA